MTERSLPFTGTTTGDAGAYSADNWADSWMRMFHAAAITSSGYENRGPLIDSGNAPNVGLQVQATSPASAAVDVLPGAAFVEGRYYESSATETVAVAANASGNPRIDTIVLRLDDAAQTVRLAIKQGTPAATPAPPALTQTAGTMWEIPIADIAVANGFTSIATTDVTPRAEWSNAADGVYLKDILNNSGDTLQTGDPVVWDSSADRAVTTTTTIDDPNTAGVWVGRTQDGDYGRVLERGVGYVRVDGSYSRGQGLVTSDTAHQALAINTVGASRTSLGILLEDSSAADTVALAYIDVHRQVLALAEYSYTVAQNTAGPTYTTGANRTVSFNTEDSDPSGVGALAANQITLQPGRYKTVFETLLKRTGTGTVEFRFYVVADPGGAATVLAVSNNYELNQNTQTSVAFHANFTLSAIFTIEMQVRVVTNNTLAATALNLAGETEKYNRWLFERYS